MLPRIGGVIAEAAMSAFRALDGNRSVVAVAPVKPAANTRRPGDAILIVTHVALIRIEINLNPSR